MIPRILTQIWIGPKALPEREAGWCLEMKRLNPTWSYRLLGNDLLERFKDDPYICHLQIQKAPLAFVADRLRMLVLHEDGGIYLDTDCLPKRPLDALPMWDEPSAEFVYGMRDPYREGVALHRSVAFCDNTVLASAPKSAMCKKILALWRPEEIQITGHRVGLCILSHADWTCRGLGHRYFYSMRSHPESIVDHDSHNLASWVADKTPIPTVRAGETITLTHK